jgi:hypothetical protein
MTRNIDSMLDYEASKNPELALIIEGITEMSNKDIDALTLPLPWFKTALKRRRASVLAGSFADNMASYGFSEDFTGEVREWVSDTAYTKVGTTDLQVTTGSLLFFPDSGGVWIDLIFSQNTFNIPRNCGRGTRATFSQYRNQCSEKRNGKYHPSTIPVFNDPHQPTYSNRPAGVRFY